MIENVRIWSEEDGIKDLLSNLEAIGRNWRAIEAIFLECGGFLVRS